MKTDRRRLSHHECHVLATVQRWQPVTAYFVRKMLGNALASDATDSPGSVYPVIERLKKAGLIIADVDQADGRGRETLRCSQDGAAIVAEWISRIEPVDMLPEDPWRTRAAFIDLLEPAAAQAWLLALLDVLEVQRTSLVDDRGGPEPSARIALANARQVTEARISWINESLTILTRRG